MYYQTKRSLYEKMYDDFVGIYLFQQIYIINMELFQRICNDFWNKTFQFEK